MQAIDITLSERRIKNILKETYSFFMAGLLKSCCIDRLLREDSICGSPVYVNLMEVTDIVLTFSSFNVAVTRIMPLPFPH